MDHKQKYNASNREKQMRKKLFSAISLVLVSVIILTTVTYAWIIMATSPEVTNISTTAGANNNLEIALATNDHIQDLLSNNMYETAPQNTFRTGEAYTIMFFGAIFWT